MKEDEAGKAAVSAGQEFDLDDPRWYLNRELTWLEFNKRVLHEAMDERNPLLERVFFLSVVSSNLDEFFMKRIGGLKQQVGAGVKKTSVDGMLPDEQIEACVVSVRHILKQRQMLEKELFTLLRNEGIEFKKYRDLEDSEKARMDSYFSENIFPLLTPQGIDPAHPFPFISNLSLNLLVVTSEDEDDHEYLNRIKVPPEIGVPRFIQCGREHQHIYITFEDLVANNLPLLFPGMLIKGSWLFRVTRNAITERHAEQANDLLVVIETALRDRKFAQIVRLEVEESMDRRLRGRLAAELDIDEGNDVYEVNGLLAKKDLIEMWNINKTDLHFPPHQPCDHPALQMEISSIFHIIREKQNILLQHPYESFETSIERFLREASRDPKVLAIKMTLYRTSSQSRIIQYLVDAAYNGKQVAVVVELMARFDESANISWAEELEEAGIHVTFGVVGLKTHSKVIFVVRRDYNGLKRYMHIGTGNYHAGTARQYSDIGLLSCDPVLGKDLTELFNYLTTGYAPVRKYKKILPCPNMLKRALLQKITREMELHQTSGGGLIQFKCNALEDKEITSALYRASQAGVRIQLILRDSCRLRPGIAGLSENISVISIVGRFLEHARVYYFRNGGKEEYYIGSADLMKRNLEARVEVVTPIEDADLQAQLREMLNAQLENTRSGWEMDADGRYTQRQPTSDKEQTVHDVLIGLAERRQSKISDMKKKKKNIRKAGKKKKRN
ncbi:polyphosphate kinase 1 [Desulfopila inferna]|uniref:polyphosphate kinase 1 n=1 Tax=Desulfopila inferna TaxID=468528 RepID=UPI001965173D|nr:polyphosphate kinase 1 [Desulfopila inferna]MBM9606566.1 polyphosphate kinase 1 [Desulfopila inferna]